MAGGIDWFRWHHGSVTDPKFQLVAKKAGARLGDVITVWAFVLEAASADADRGTIGPLDFETMDFLLGAEEGTAIRILDAMSGRGLIVGSLIAQWDKRQPKRERDDPQAADRQRAKCERDAAQVTNQNNVTPCHATSRQEKPRGEESRGEEIQEAPTVLVLDAGASEDPKPAAYVVPDCPHAELVEVYHAVLPTLPRCEVLNDQRRGYMRQRWREVCAEFRLSKAEALEWWRGYFSQVSHAPFLMGQAPPGRDGRLPFRADLEWLTRPNNFAKVVEGRYSGARQ